MNSTKLTTTCNSDPLVQVIQYKHLRNGGVTSVFFVVSDLWDEAQQNPNKNIYHYDHSLPSKADAQAKAYVEWSKSVQMVSVATENYFNDIQPMKPFRIICVELF